MGKTLIESGPDLGSRLEQASDFESLVLFFREESAPKNGATVGEALCVLRIHWGTQKMS